MKILLVSATVREVNSVLDFLEINFQKSSELEFEKSHLTVKVLITGVGMTATVFVLTRALLSQPFDWVLNAGICGAFDRNLPIGQVVNVVEERFGDLGAEENDGSLLSLFDLGLQQPDDFPFQDGVMKNNQVLEQDFLPRASGLSVNKVHGSEVSIQTVRAKFPMATVETMESAAVFYACLQTGVPFLVVRAVSNYVEPRNRAAWEVGLAIENLNRTLIEILKVFEK